MDPQSILQKLEEAAKVLLAPPNLVTKEQRNQAESIFIEFRKFSFPYETCRFILEHSKNDYAQFQASSTIKTSIVREWATLPPADVEQLRMFLLHYVTSHLSLQPYVREEIFQTLAVIVKRGMLESDAIAKDKIFNEVTQLISTGNLSMQLIACSLLTALLNEFSSNTKSAGTGFTWEFHIRCKRHFENTHLLQTMIFTLQVLHELVKCETPFGREQLPVMMRFLSISEQILSWEFLPIRLTRRHMVPFSNINEAPFRPPISWRDTVFNGELLSLFFSIYSKVHYNSELSHHALQCLSQLASLNGRIFPNDDSQRTYLTFYIVNFVKTIKSLELQDYDAIGISTIFENLLRWHKVELYGAIPAHVLTDFIQWKTRITCRYITAAEKAGGEDDLYSEALGKMLFSWTSLLTDSDDHFPTGQFKKQATEIFNKYVECHINTRVEAPQLEDEEYEAEDVPDKEKFSEHLASIGVLGRKVPEHSLPTLARVIDARTEKFKLELEQLSQSTKSGVRDEYGTARLNSIFEDLHWLILITTSVLTDDARGETSLMPTEILRYSMSQANYIDAQQTLNLIIQPELCSKQATQTNNVDYVIRLLSSILRLFYIQSIAVQSRLGHSLSPQLDSTSMFCMRRFIDAYLVPSEDNYAEMSITLQSILGRDSEGAACYINLLIEKINLNLSVWNSEPEVIEETLETLVTLVSRSVRSSQVVKCSSFWSFATAVGDNSFPFNSLPASSKRLLYKALIYCGTAMVEQREEYWTKMVRKPLSDFTQLVCDESFHKKKDDSVVRERLIHGLEMLIGCCQATRINNQTVLFDIVEPCLQATITLLDVCHSYSQLVELCLEVFCEVVSSMICCLESTSSERLFEQCLSAIHMYAKHNKGRRAYDAEVEEEKFRDILLILKLLVNLMSKDLIDFGLSDSGETLTISATEVVLFGLAVIVPLMDISLLQFPSLCSQYYKLLNFISELRPDKILELPTNLLDMILSSVHLSLSRFGSDVAKAGYEFLTEIAMYVANTKNLELAQKAKLDSFIQPVLHMLLFEPFDVDLCDIISGCLYYLIILYPTKYRELEVEILRGQTGRSHHDLLQQCFLKLSFTTMAAKGVNRQEKIKFIDNMNQLLLDVKGFLCIM